MAIGAQIGAGILGAVNQQQAGQAAASAANFRAAQTREAGRQELEVARAEEVDFRRDSARLFGERRAQLGASGTQVGTGSNLLASGDFQEEVELAAQRIRQGGELKKARLEAEARLDQLGGENAAQAGTTGAAASLLSTGASLFGSGGSAGAGAAGAAGAGGGVGAASSASAASAGNLAAGGAGGPTGLGLGAAGGPGGGIGAGVGAGAGAGSSAGVAAAGNLAAGSAGGPTGLGLAAAGGPGGGVGSGVAASSSAGSAGALSGAAGSAIGVALPLAVAYFGSQSVRGSESSQNDALRAFFTGQRGIQFNWETRTDPNGLEGVSFIDPNTGEERWMDPKWRDIAQGGSFSGHLVPLTSGGMYDTLAMRWVSPEEIRQWEIDRTVGKVQTSESQTLSAALDAVNSGGITPTSGGNTGSFQVGDTTFTPEPGSDAARRFAALSGGNTSSKPIGAN